MAVSNFHLRHQGPVLAGLARVAWAALTQKIDPAAPPPTCPGPVYTELVPPRPDALVGDLVRWAGGDARAWRGRLPAYMFPQWGFPSLARTLNGVPYPLPKVLNQGCRITVEEPLPAGEVLRLESHLHGVDDNGQRARLHQRLVTTTDSGGRVVADVFAYVPLAKKKKGGKHSGPPIVPLDCREIARRQLRSNAGLEFAILTGDFNPVHWLRAYARLAGFKSTILHGFGTLSIAVEAVIAGQWSGDIRRFGGVDVRFTRPLVLPAKLGVFVGAADAEGRIPLAVGKAPGGAAVMLGHIWPKEPLKLPAAASALEEQ